jgi:LPXTG-site transpeptidase (sortase) family protein
MAEITGKPINLLTQAKKLFGFFCVCFIVLFFVFSLVAVIQSFSKGIRQIILAQDNQLSGKTEITSLAIDSEGWTVVKNFTATEKENSVQIPKLGVEAPLVFAASQDAKIIAEDFKIGVVVYPGSAEPGDPGQLIILGHSAPPGWPKIRYEWVFSKLGDLKAGDEILVNFEKKQYRYQITKQIFLERGEEIPQKDQASLQSVLYLVTCWPPGRDLRRLAVEAVGLTPHHY